MDMDEAIGRRQVLSAVAGSASVALAGCLDTEDDPEEDGAPNEAEAVGSEGLLYAFSSDRISVVDPDEGEVVDEITEGIAGEDWADPRITRDHSRIYVVRESPSQTVVVDTETRRVVGEVDVGTGANHAHLPNEGEVWVHADDEGTFYVIDTETDRVAETVTAGLDSEGHGKLLYHPDLGTKAYATNVNDPGIAVVDLDEYERTDFVEFAEVGGTHYKAYSPENSRAYIEFDTGTVVVDAENDETVDELDPTGAMYLSPDETRLVIVDGDDLHLYDVTGDTQDVGTITVDEGPSSVRFDQGGDRIFTANVGSEDVAVVSIDESEVVERIDAGAVEGRSRLGVTGGGYFFTSASADGTVTVVDTESHDSATVDVGGDVDTVQYVGDSGIGYRGV